MRKSILFVLVLLNTAIFAQDSLSQAGIFKVRLYVDKALTNKVMINSVNQTGGIYSSFRLPNPLKDSIMDLIVHTVKQQLYLDATYIYDLKSDGSKRTTMETGTYAGGFPKMTKKRAYFGYEEELYVKIKIKVTGFNGPSIGMSGVQYSNIHPSVKFKVKAFDIEKKKVYSKKIRLWDFEKIRSIQFSTPLTTVTNTNALNADQIYQMIKHTILVFNEEAERNR
ncbi:MAG: hypothetical protein ACKOXP_09315 [Flavobacteriales bacterium]